MFFSDIGGTEERHAHYYIHTRVRRARTRAYAQGKGRGNTGKVKKMRKGKQNGNPRKKEKRTEEKGIERLKRKKAGRRGNRSKGGKYEKKGRDRSLLKFYTIGKRKNYAIRNNSINILRGTD